MGPACGGTTLFGDGGVKDVAAEVVDCCGGVLDNLDEAEMVIESEVEAIVW